MFDTLIVVNDESIEKLQEHLPNVLGFEDYLRNYPKQNEPKIRVINLCDTTDYLSKGYYCSLLGEARKHAVIPSVRAINEIRHQMLDEEYRYLSKSELASFKQEAESETYMVYFGEAALPALQKLANRIYYQYPLPIIKLTIVCNNGRYMLQISSCPFIALNEEQQSQFLARLAKYIQAGTRGKIRKKQYRWNMAILVNPNEQTPPSNREALSRFAKAARKFGILAELASIDQLQNITQYDALFIRETTAIDHHTYRLATRAEANRMIVLDDPTSILRCCNKVFLHDAFTYSNIPSLKTEIIADCTPTSITHIEQVFEYPVILKLPEGAFSKFVFKVDNRQMLEERLQYLFERSALVLAQEYMYTEYDWRIGLLNGRPIYACKYYMANKYWKIYNHESKRFASGRFETLPTFEVPKSVLDAAIKAAKLIGSGLYGVDIKLVDKQAYVLEVNDNPSIDHGVEDHYLGDELYMILASEFLRRLEIRGR